MNKIECSGRIIIRAIKAHVYKSTEHFTHHELRLVRCNRRDLDRSRLGLVRPTENCSRHFRDEGQPPGEPPAQFSSPADPNAGSGALVAPEFHSRSQVRAILSFLSTILVHGDTHTHTRARARAYTTQNRRRCPSRRVTTWLFRQTSHLRNGPSRRLKYEIPSHWFPAWTNRRRSESFATVAIYTCRFENGVAPIEAAEKLLTPWILILQSPDKSHNVMTTRVTHNEPDTRDGKNWLDAEAELCTNARSANLGGEGTKAREGSQTVKRSALASTFFFFLSVSWLKIEKNQKGADTPILAPSTIVWSTRPLVRSAWRASTEIESR